MKKIVRGILSLTAVCTLSAAHIPNNPSKQTFKDFKLAGTFNRIIPSFDCNVYFNRNIAKNEFSVHAHPKSFRHITGFVSGKTLYVHTTNNKNPNKVPALHVNPDVDCESGQSLEVGGKGSYIFSKTEPYKTLSVIALGLARILGKINAQNLSITLKNESECNVAVKSQNLKLLITNNSICKNVITAGDIHLHLADQGHCTSNIKANSLHLIAKNKATAQLQGIVPQQDIYAQKGTSINTEQLKSTIPSSLKEQKSKTSLTK